MRNYIKIGKLFLHDPVRSRHESEIFIGSSEHDEATRLIIIVDFPRARTDQSYLIDIIIKDVVETFDSSGEGNPEVLLEQILKVLNENLPQVSPQKNKGWLRELNLLVAISDKGQLHFSHLGDIDALLLQEGRLSSIAERQSKINPLKLFSNITSGILNPGDSIILTTTALTDYLSEVKIKNILKNYPAAEAAHAFEDQLAEVPSFVTFCAAILSFDVASQTEKTPQRTSMPARTVVENLTPLPRKVDSDQLSQQRRRRADKRRLGGGMDTRWLKASFVFFVTNAGHYFKLLGTVLAHLFRGIIGAFRFSVSKNYRSEKEHHVWKKIDSAVSNTSGNIQNTSRLTQILLGVSLLILIVLINIIIFSGQVQQTEKKLDFFNEGLVTIATAQTEVDSLRAIGNDAEAERKIIAMQALSEQLLPTSKDQEDQLAYLQESLLRQLTEVRRINYIEEPLLLHDASSLGEDLAGLDILDGVIYGYTPEAIYRISDDTTRIVNTPTSTQQLVPNSARGTLFVMTDDDILQIKNDALDSADLSVNDRMQSVDSVLMYADNLYILDRDAGIIFKHSGSNNGTIFQAGTIWLDDPDLIRQSQSFAIDGNIFILTTQGEIVKLFQGERETFTYQRPHPNFGADASIYTRTDSELLYILDPANQRVAIINKDGNIQDQYISGKFDNLKSLAIDKDEKTLYILNGNEIYLLAIKK